MMATFDLANFATIPAMLALVGATMLVTGGLALIASGNRTRDQTLGARVELVRPPRPSPRMVEPTNDHLIRSPVTGMPVTSQRAIIRRFGKFGVPADRALTYFTAARLAVMVILGALAFVGAQSIPEVTEFPAMPYVIFAFIAIASWFLPNMAIAYGVRRRNSAIRSGLPDALELLVICVEAGLSLEDGLDRVITELRRSQSALAEELDLTLADLRILPSRDQALSNMAERVDIPSVRSVVTTLTQTLRFGTPLAQSLRVVASEMRNDYLIEMEARANRLPALLTLPVMLFLMPTIFLIVGGPAALTMMDAFNR